MPKPIQFKKLLLLMLLFSSSTNVFSQQIQKYYITNQWEDSRYNNHNDGTVTDTKTGLMWKRCSEGLGGSYCSGYPTTHTYKEAIELAENTTFATYSDWRLPNIKELASLVSYDDHYPAINGRIFPNTQSSEKYWSSSPIFDNDDRDHSWRVDFGNGTDNYGYRSSSSYVRLVRGGQ